MRWRLLGLAMGLEMGLATDDGKMSGWLMAKKDVPVKREVRGG